MKLIAFLAFARCFFWVDPNPPEMGVTHYVLDVGIQSLVAGNPPVASYVSIPPVSEDCLKGFDFGTTYYLAIKAWNVNGPSLYSNEIVWTPIPPGQDKQDLPSDTILSP